MINEDGCSQINTNLTEKEGYEWIKKAQISVPLQWGSNEIPLRARWFAGKISHQADKNLRRYQIRAIGLQLEIYVCVYNCLLWSLYPHTERNVKRDTENAKKCSQIFVSLMAGLSSEPPCTQREEQKFVPFSLFHNFFFFYSEQIQRTHIIVSVDNQ